MSGRWEELEHPWHDTNVVHCPVCGFVWSSLEPRVLREE